MKKKIAIIILGICLLLYSPSLDKNATHTLAATSSSNVTSQKVEVPFQVKRILLLESKKSEKTLLTNLKNAFNKLEKSRKIDIDSKDSYRDIAVALAVIDRKMDYIGWNDINGLLSTLEKGLPIVNIPITIKDPLSFTYGDRLMISRVKGNTQNMLKKVKKIKVSRLKGPRNKIPETIIVQYNKNHYNCANQNEYNQVITEIKRAIKEMNSLPIGGEYSEYYNMFLEGKRWSGNKNDRSDQNIGLFIAEEVMGILVKAGVNKKEIVKLIKAQEIAQELKSSIPNQDVEHFRYEYYWDNLDNFWLKKSPSNYVISLSAYDGLIRGLEEEEARRQITSAVFDIFGYKTKVAKAKGFGDVVAIWIKGKWRAIDWHNFKTVTF